MNNLTNIYSEQVWQKEAEEQQAQMFWEPKESF